MLKCGWGKPHKRRGSERETRAVSARILKRVAPLTAYTQQLDGTTTMSVNSTGCLNRTSPLSFTGMRISTGRWLKHRNVGCVFHCLLMILSNTTPKPRMLPHSWLFCAACGVGCSPTEHVGFDFNVLKVEWWGLLILLFRNRRCYCCDIPLRHSTQRAYYSGSLSVDMSWLHLKRLLWGVNKWASLTRHMRRRSASASSSFTLLFNLYNEVWCCSETSCVSSVYY